MLGYRQERSEVVARPQRRKWQARPYQGDVSLRGNWRDAPSKRGRQERDFWKASGCATAAKVCGVRTNRPPDRARPEQAFRSMDLSGLRDHALRRPAGSEARECPMLLDGPPPPDRRDSGMPALRSAGRQETPQPIGRVSGPARDPRRETQGQATLRSGVPRPHCSGGFSRCSGLQLSLICLQRGPHPLRHEIVLRTQSTPLRGVRGRRDVRAEVGGE